MIGQKSCVVARFLPTAIILTLFLLVNVRNVGVVTLAGIYGFLCASLVLLTLLGIATGKLARNNQEVHLYGALAVVILAFVCGITPHPEKLAGIVEVMAWNPVSRLSIVLTQAATGSTSYNSVELIFSTSVLVGIVAIAILRWIAGGTKLNA